MKLTRLIFAFVFFVLLALPALADQSNQSTITANAGTVILSTAGMSTVRFTVSGTWSGTLGVNGQQADGSWSSISFHRTDDGSGTKTTTFTSNLSGKMAIGGYQAVEVIATAWTSGTATVSITASSAPSMVETIQSNAANLQMTPQAPNVSWADHSTSACTANAWTQFTVSSTSRHELDFYNLSASTIYIAFTASNSAPTGTPSTTGNSSPGAIPIGPGGAWQTNLQGAIGGYGWYYCTSAIPFTEEEF